MSNIYVYQSSLVEVFKQLLKDMAVGTWALMEDPSPSFDDGVNKQFIYMSLDGRHGMVYFNYIPIDDFEPQRVEIVDHIDVNLLEGV